MAKTKFINAETVVTSNFLNQIFGGLTIADGVDAADPLVAGHIHDGIDEDGHVEKISLADHVTGELDGSMITDSSIPQAKLAFSIENTIIAQDEGSVVTGGPHTTLNFVGSGVTVSDAGSGVATVTISGGGGGGGTLNETLVLGNQTLTENIIVNEGDIVEFGDGTEGVIGFGGDSEFFIFSSGYTGAGGAGLGIPFSIYTGDVTVTDASSGPDTGFLQLFTGGTSSSDAGGTGGDSGYLSLFTGAASDGSGTSGNTGDISLTTGDSDSGNSGNISITTGDAATGSRRGDLQVSSEQVILNNRVFTSLSGSGITGSANLTNSVGLTGIVISNDDAGVNSQAVYFKAIVVAHAAPPGGPPAADDTAVWQIEGFAQRDQSTDTLTLPVAPIVTPLYNPNPFDWDADMVVDNASKELRVRVTNNGFGGGPGAAPPITAVAEVELVAAVTPLTV